MGEPRPAGQADGGYFHHAAHAVRCHPGGLHGVSHGGLRLGAQEGEGAGGQLLQQLGGEVHGIESLVGGVGDAQNMAADAYPPPAQDLAADGPGEHQGAVSRPLKWPPPRTSLYPLYRTWPVKSAWPGRGRISRF